jgi:hypothetical protein
MGALTRINLTYAKPELRDKNLRLDPPTVKSKNPSKDDLTSQLCLK